ncbi:MAG TPA: hypothetical protein VH598_02795, partial [Verrucomicrobiae bacterium]|nr:hypothetical protein [Verrucomicrobiae bacterium]
MRSPIAALAWEIWRRNRVLVFLAAGIISFCSLTSLIVPGRVRALNLEPWYFFLMVCSLGLVFAIFHHAEFNRRKNWHGFPYRLFSLPLPTLVLVACPMVMGVASVELAYLAWAQLVFAPLGRTISLWPAFVLATGLMCYQAIIWGLAGFRITRIMGLAITGMGLMSLASLPLLLQVWPRKNAMAIATWVVIGLALCAFLGGWYFVGKQRRGGGRGKGWVKEWMANFAAALLRRRKNFDSPAAAQFWLEWRRAGSLLPIYTGAALVLVIGPVSWLLRRDADSTMVTLGWTLALPLILGTVIGAGFVKPDFWSGDLSVTPFQAVRPLPSGEIVVTKMKVAAWAVAISWLLVLLFLSIWIPVWANNANLKELWDLGVVLYPRFSLCAILILFLGAAMILTWRGMVSGLWVGLSGSLKLFAGVAILYVAMLSLAVWGTVFWANHFDWKRLEHYVTWTSW